MPFVYKVHHLKKWQVSLLKRFSKFCNAIGTSFECVYVSQIDKSLSKSFAMRSLQFKDQVCVHLMRFGWGSYEYPTPLIVATLCKRGSNFIDIGANTGFFSLLAYASGAQHTYACEPVASIYEHLLSNIKLNCAAGAITPLQIGISNFRGTASLYLPASEKYVETSASLDRNFRANSSELSINVDTVDHSILPFISGSPETLCLFKIDVENCEHQVLEGMTFTLETVRPILILEMLGDNENAEKAIRILQRENYVELNIYHATQRLHGKNSFFVPIELRTSIIQLLTSNTSLIIK